jgi:hypothetical protein
MATRPATRRLRNRVSPRSGPPCPPAPRNPMSCTWSIRDSVMAGRTPTSRAVIPESAIASQSARASTAISCRRGTIAPPNERSETAPAHSEKRVRATDEHRRSPAVPRGRHQMPRARRSQSAVSDDASATSSEGQTNGDLAAPCRTAGQQETRDVCTHNEQHDADRDRQGAKCRPARGDGLLLDALDIEAADAWRKGLRQRARGRLGTATPRQ